MKPKKLALVLVIVLLLPVFVSVAYADVSSDIDAKINSIMSYAKQYEEGKLNLLQLKAHTHLVREDINKMLNEYAVEAYFSDEYGERVEKRLSQDAIKQIFGKPTEMTFWVWNENEQHEEKLDASVPRWEKVIFDGYKIQVVFNAHPNTAKDASGNQIIFYWVDFNVRFKKQFDKDISAMVNEVKGLASDFYKGETSGEEVVSKAVSYEQMINSYLWENRENCERFMNDVFSSSERASDQRVTRWSISLLGEEPGKRKGDAKLEMGTCEDCDWPWIWVWVDAWQNKGKPDVEFEFDRDALVEELRKKSIDELKSEFAGTLDNAVQAAKSFDFNKLIELRSRLEVLNQVLDEKFYSDEKTRDENYEKRLDWLESLFGKYGKVQKESMKEERWEKILIKDIQTVRDSWCAQLELIPCNEGYGCIEGECVYARGGKEECRNRKDDDSDSLIDCMDPDCDIDCGRVCKEQCQPCWEKSQEICGDVCEECNECQKDNKNCESVCQKECWPCHGEKTKEFCQDCWDCNNEARTGKCLEDCGEDSACQATCLQEPGAQDSELNKCLEACKTTDSVVTCKDLCYQDVTFICSSKRQKVPCEDTSYNCNGKTQDLPCFLYTCPDGSQQTEPVDLYPCEVQEKTCENNQYLDKQGNCVCAEGFDDCDKISENGCECTTAEAEGEICSNLMDDDSDNLVDCSDLIDCEGKTCEQESNKVCVNGACTFSLIEVPECVPTNETSCEEVEEEQEEAGILPGECVLREDCREGSVCIAGKCEALEVMPEIPETVPSGENVTSEIIEEEVEVTSPEEALQRGEEAKEKGEIEKQEPVDAGAITGNLILTPVALGAKSTGLKDLVELITGKATDTETEVKEEKDEQIAPKSDKKEEKKEEPQWRCKPEDCNHPRQYCDKEKGWCMCETGWGDCDGDWMNGCEREMPAGKWCDKCLEDSQCAEPRCADWEPSIIKFGCFESEPREEEKGRFQFSGTCSNSETRQEANIHFDFWGEKFNELQELRQKQEFKYRDEWCKWELESALKKRAEIKDSFDEGFVAWFFEDYVQKDMEKWERQVGGIWDVYWEIVETDRQIARASVCLNQDFPELEKIEVKYESEFGSVEIWEEESSANMEQVDPGSEETGNVKILSPYMKIWLFPPKEVIKSMLSESMATGTLPGAKDDERTGLSPKEIQKIKEDPDKMEFINKMSEKYGGQARIYLRIVEEDGTDVFRVLVTLDPENVAKIEVGKTANPEEYDVEAVMKFDFLYKMIESQEKDMQGTRKEVPPWEKRPAFDKIKDVGNNAKMFGIIVGAIASGDIKLTPRDFDALRVFELVMEGK